MIKINLTRTQLNNPAGGAAPTIGAAPMGGGGGMGGLGGASEGARDAVVKVLVIVIFTAGLYLYERQQLSTLQAERSAAQSKATETENEVASKLKEIDSVKDYGNQAKELSDKLKILKLLSHLRLREVKTLDFMQSSIPEKVWLRTLDFETEKDDPIHAHLNFKGSAAATEDLAEFTKRLEDSAYLTEVITIRNQETVQTGPKVTTSLREFEFTAQVEVKN